MNNTDDIKKADEVKKTKQEDSFFCDKFRSGLRGKYIPHTKVSAAFFSVAPWLNVLILVIAFMTLLKSQVLVPGFSVSLPNTSFSDGVHSRLVITVRSLPFEKDVAETNGADFVSEGKDDGAIVAPLNLVVFFNDTRFNLSQSYSISSFRNSISSFVQRYDERIALLYIDEKVPHKETVGLIGVLRDTGISNVCYVVKGK